MQRERIPFESGTSEVLVREAELAPRALDPGPQAPRTVLVVEDDPEIRDALEDLLDTEGYLVRSAENGCEALRILETMPPRECVMLLDMMMPVMSGLELLDVLERTHRLDGIPVIVLTASSASNVERARAVLHKPAAVGRILSEVASCFAELAGLRAPV
jgi:two-component system chemotaxis response regulator CheY